jgi:GNAT superfamily N-acetyltransferase
MLVIRPAERSDSALILAFVRKLAEYERLLHVVAATEADVARDLFGENPRVFCDLAFWDGTPAGFALWFHNYSTFHGRHGLYLEDLFVEPAFRGRGIGKALLRRLAQRCQSDGLNRLEWQVLNWNSPSIAFYKSLGAVAVDDWTVFRLTGEALKKLAETNSASS